MFYTTDYIKTLKETIKYLRDKNDELLNIIMILKDKDIQFNQSKMLKQVQKEVVTPVDSMNKKIDDIKAETEEEKKQKDLAKKQLEDLIIR